MRESLRRGNGIQFRAKAEHREPDEPTVTVDEQGVTVADNGPGIPERELPGIFDKFWQASKTADQGAGLGRDRGSNHCAYI